MKLSVIPGQKITYVRAPQYTQVYLGNKCVAQLCARTGYRTPVGEVVHLALEIAQIEVL